MRGNYLIASRMGEYTSHPYKFEWPLHSLCNYTLQLRFYKFMSNLA